MTVSVEVSPSMSLEPHLHIERGFIAHGDPDPMQLEPFFVEQHDDVYLASKPAVGALSVLYADDLLALHVYHPVRNDREAAIRQVADFYESLGYERSDADAFVARMENDGWTRTAVPVRPDEPLQSVYFTVTRRCDLACPYCYQGLANRYFTEMSVEQAALSLDKIRGVNPHCQIIITGGEPFSHSRIFEILDLVAERGFPFVILTNGSYIDSETAQRIKKLPGFRYIQMSIDGMSEEVHALTRGKGHFEKIMRAINAVITNELPFVLAPTMHNKNLQDLYDIAALAISHGGWCSPNNLREFPHPGLKFDEVKLDNDQCLQALRDMNTRLIAHFGLALMATLADRYKGPEICSVETPNARFICGMAHSLMDLDWNGDIYPCHLTKDKKLILGNLYRDDFDTIFANVERRHIRVKSHEIPKCSGCKFTSTCGGGCRAGAWFAYGSLAREDSLCDMNYNSELRKVLVGAKTR